MTSYNHILTELRRLAAQLFANLPVSVYLYGSRARGDSHENSDWDILILADDALNSRDTYERFAYPFTVAGWKLGQQINPLLYTRTEWAAEKGTSFYLNVERDAIQL